MESYLNNDSLLLCLFNTPPSPMNDDDARRNSGFATEEHTERMDSTEGTYLGK